MILVLLALVLAVANVGNFLLLRSTLKALEAGEGRLAGEASERVLRELTAARTARAMVDPAVAAIEFPPTRLRAVASRQGLLDVDLVAPDAAYLSSSSPSRLGSRDPDFHAWTAEDEWHPASGEVWWRGPSWTDDGPQAIVHYQPVRGADGVLVGYLRIAMESPALAWLGHAYQLIAWSQAIVLVAAGIVSFGLSRWLSRPWRLIAAAVGEASGRAEEAALEDDSPDALVVSFRGVVDKLRHQEEELRRLAPLGGGGAVRSGDEDPVAGFLRTVGSTLVSGVIAVDVSGRIAGINAAAAALFPPADPGGGDMLGRGLEEALPASEPLVRLIRSVLSEGAARSRELVPYRAADGGVGTLGVSVSPVGAQGRWPGGVFCLVSDLSEIAALRERDRLREGLASIGELSAGIAHEYRNSLATILGYARLVEREGPGTPSAGWAAAIGREVETVRAAVDEFLRFARPARLVRAPADLRALCEAAAEDARRDGALQRLDVRIDGELPPVVADEAALRQAIGNLLRNAAESDPDRTVTVRIRAEAAGESVRLLVSDDGPGIRAEDLDRIFLPFFTTKPTGTGLGLAIAQKTILEHDGSIRASSGPGGTTFEILLPASGAGSFRNSLASRP